MYYLKVMLSTSIFAQMMSISLVMPESSRQKIINDPAQPAPGLYLIQSKKVFRHWELDLFRGIVVIAMIFYHLVFDLIRIFGVTPFVGQSFWMIGPDLIGGGFLVIAGVASVLSNNNDWPSVAKRGGKIFGVGMGLTLVTLLFTDEYIIVFGILHCIGLSIILGTPFLRLSAKQIGAVAIPILISGYIFEHMGYYGAFTHWIQETLLDGRMMLDFFSLYPFFAYYLLGICIGKSLWNSIHGRYQMSRAVRPIVYLGKRSLWVYLIHQPVLVAFIYLVKMAYLNMSV